MVEMNWSSPSTIDAGLEYEIKVKGHLEDHWADWLGGLTITHDPQGYSHLTGVIVDQAALHGILAQIRDLGLTLISLMPKSAAIEESAVFLTSSESHVCCERIDEAFPQ